MIKKLENNGFISLSNIKIVNAENGELSVDITEKHLNPYNIVHGGLIYTLADTAMGISLESVGHFITINSSINFIKKAKCDKLSSKVEKIKIGNNIATLKCDIYDEQNNLISTVIGTYSKLHTVGDTNER